MVREYEFYHGAAIARLVSISRDLQVKRLDRVGAGCYEFNRTIGSMIKYATDRLTPWGFTFQAEHKRMLKDLQATYGTILLLLVCKDDGIVALDYDAITQLIGSGAGVSAVSVSRRPRQMYQVSGTLGRLSRKLAEMEHARMLLGAD